MEVPNKPKRGGLPKTMGEPYSVTINTVTMKKSEEHNKITNYLALVATQNYR